MTASRDKIQSLKHSVCSRQRGAMNERVQSAGNLHTRSARSTSTSTTAYTDDERTKVCRYNWHSAGCLDWPLPTLKYTSFK